MAMEPLGDAIRRLGRTAGLQAALSLTDAQLLEQFVARRDEPAFTALMARHGPMVLCLCRQMLRDAEDAEDAFQAAFLVLVRNAGAIRKRPSLSAWLYGVAYKVAARLRGRAERRRTLERPGVDLSAVPAVGEPVAADLRFILHEEIRRLPDKYRAPVLLCYLEGKTNEVAAQELRWPVGTLKARLFRAREMLRMRLARRGLGAAAELLSVESAPSAARNTASVVPLFLLASTMRAAMRLANLKGTAAAVVALCLLGAGAKSLSCLSPPSAPNTASHSIQPIPSAQAPEAPTAAPQDTAKADPVPEQIDKPASNEWQAHPFPQQPSEHKAGPDKEPNDSGCTMDG